VKDLLKDLDKAFENKLRLGIMSALLVNDFLDFNALKEILDATDGNLASHLKTLEKEGYITFTKEFVDRKPNTKYMVTGSGKEAFIKHLKAIENLLK
jgi:DNA-binding MarR family transcriptional regulator